MTDKTETSDIVAQDLDDVSKAVAEINATEAGITDLAKQYDKVVFEVGTTKGMDEAKKARQEIRQPRYTIETLRKAAKAPVLALGRSLDARARQLTAKILAIEEPVDKQIKDEEQRKEDARLARIKEEEQRIAGHRKRIDSMVSAVDIVWNNIDMSSADAQDCIDTFEANPIATDFEEFQDEAKEKWSDCLRRLKEHHNTMVLREAEELRQAERDAELEQLRKEKEDRDAADALVRAEEREVERQAEEKRKAALPPTVEEQLDPGTADLVASGGLPEAQPPKETKQDTVVAAVKPVADAFPDYPGAEYIVDVLVDHFPVGRPVIKHWLARYAADLTKELQA